MLAFSFIPLLAFLQTVTASAIPSTIHPLERRAVTQLSTTQIAAYEPYTQFAKVAYCPSHVIDGWKCGST